MHSLFLFVELFKTGHARFALQLCMYDKLKETKTFSLLRSKAA